MNLTNKDYKKIVEYYNLDKKINNKSVKQLAEDVLANKLCRCIKKVKNDKINETDAISLCRESIFKKRNIDFYNFKCKNKSRLIHKKYYTKRYLKKFSKKIGFNKTKKSKKNQSKK